MGRLGNARWRTPLAFVVVRQKAPENRVESIGMEPETLFRIALLVIIVLTMTVTIPFRLQASKTKERFDRKQEGRMLAIALRLLGLGLWVSTFLYLIDPSLTSWSRLPMPMGIRWIGVGVGVLCPALFYWTLSSLGRNLTDTVGTRLNAYLVTHGPYRWVRHPFYVCAALLMTAVTVLTANALIGFCSLGVLSLLALRTPREEAVLVERFGDAYRNYQNQTGRFWPRFTKADPKKLR
jgi:protein-S-isoprenylcysteine O-methyltransferase Ste14